VTRAERAAKARQNGVLTATAQVAHSAMRSRGLDGPWSASAIFQQTHNQEEIQPGQQSGKNQHTAGTPNRGEQSVLGQHSELSLGRGSRN